MGDYNPYQIWVYDCPPEEQPAAAEILSPFTISWGEFDAPEDGTVNISELYTESEGGLTDRGSIAARLIAAAPGASFYSWQGPWPGAEGDAAGSGAVTAYTPRLGRYDGNGRPVLYLGQVRRILRDHPGAADAELEVAFAQEMGEAWRTDWLTRTGQLRPAPNADAR